METREKTDAPVHGTSSEQYTIEGFIELEKAAYANLRPFLKCKYKCDANLISRGVGGNPCSKGFRRLRVACQACNKSQTFQELMDALALDVEAEVNKVGNDGDKYPSFESKMGWQELKDVANTITTVNKYMDNLPVIDRQAEKPVVANKAKDRQVGATQRTLFEYMPKEFETDPKKAKTRHTEDMEVSSQNLDEAEIPEVPKIEEEVVTEYGKTAITTIEKGKAKEILDEMMENRTIEEGEYMEEDIQYTEVEDNDDTDSIIRSLIEKNAKLVQANYEIVAKNQKLEREKYQLQLENQKLKSKCYEQDNLIAKLKSTKPRETTNFRGTQSNEKNKWKSEGAQNSKVSTWAMVAKNSTPPKPGNEARSRARQMIKKPMQALTEREKEKIISYGQERPEPQTFHRCYISFNTIPNEHIRDTKKRMIKFLKVVGLWNLIRTFSSINKSIIEIYYCRNTAGRVAEVINERKLRIIKGFDPTDLGQLSEELKPERVKQVATRLGYMLAYENLAQMRATIIRGYSRNIVELTLAKEKEVRAVREQSWDKRFNKHKNPGRTLKVTEEELIQDEAVGEDERYEPTE